MSKPKKTVLTVLVEEFPPEPGEVPICHSLRFTIAGKKYDHFAMREMEPITSRTAPTVVWRPATPAQLEEILLERMRFTAAHP